MSFFDVDLELHRAAAIAIDEGLLVAREAIDEGRYGSGNSLAAEAEARAKGITKYSRTRDFRQRVAALNNTLNVSLQTGASFFQSQAVFNFTQMEDFISDVEKREQDIRKKTLMGLIPLRSKRMIEFLNNLPGINVPKEIADRVINAKDPAMEGIEVCIEALDLARSFGLGGAHIMPVGKLSSLEKIVESI